MKISKNGIYLVTQLENGDVSLLINTISALNMFAVNIILSLLIIQPFQVGQQKIQVLL